MIGEEKFCRFSVRDSELLSSRPRPFSGYQVIQVVKRSLKIKSARIIGESSNVILGFPVFKDCLRRGNGTRR